MYQEQQSKQCKEILRKNNLNPIKKLGKGGFGLVYLVSKTDFTTYETELFSVKCTNKRNFVKKPVLRRYLKQQIMLLQSLHHPNIVRLIRTFQDDGWIFMVMEYCDTGNLTTIQNQKVNRVFSFRQSRKIMNEIIQGLEFMHSRKVIHRDIKPENILLTKDDNEDERMITKICDLGFARQAEQEAETFCGTTYYMAPEIFQKKKYNYKVDIWALGILLFSMLYGNQPFKSINMLLQIQQKCEKGFDMTRIKTMKNQSITSEETEMLKQLFKDIFVLDPEKRISLEQIRERLNYPKLSCSQKTSLKQTVSSQQSSQEQFPQFFIQEIQFIQDIWAEVVKNKFLTPMQELALKYYFDKVCLSILSENANNTCESRNTINLREKFRKSQTTDSINLTTNLSRVGIKKFTEVFSSKNSTDFKQFKEAYRLVVGHAFYKAHKEIQNKKLKNQMKLKLFCCHVINRVFDKAHVHDLFKYYYEWLCVKKKQLIFSLTYFQDWIKEEKTQKIIQTVQLINNKFYRKNK